MKSTREDWSAEKIASYYRDMDARFKEAAVTLGKAQDEVLRRGFAEHEKVERRRKRLRLAALMVLTGIVAVVTITVYLFIN